MNGDAEHVDFIDSSVTEEEDEDIRTDPPTPPLTAPPLARPLRPPLIIPRIAPLPPAGPPRIRAPTGRPSLAWMLLFPRRCFRL